MVDEARGGRAAKRKERPPFTVRCAGVKEDGTDCRSRKVRWELASGEINGGVLILAVVRLRCLACGGTSLWKLKR